MVARVFALYYIPLRLDATAWWVFPSIFACLVFVGIWERQQKEFTRASRPVFLTVLIVAAWSYGRWININTELQKARYVNPMMEQFRRGDF